MNSTNPSVVLDEDVLIAKASSGDLQAFNQLVLIYQNMAFYHASAIFGDPTMAEEATQEGFIKAFHGLNGFRGGSFRSWLLKIITNAAYDILRRSRRYSTQALFPEGENGEEIESPSWIMDPAASVQAEVEKREMSEEIYRMLDELPVAYRSVLTLVDLYEMEYEEAARALNIPLGTVKSRLARARLQMQEKLKERVNFDGHFTRAGSLAA